jgi:hypothetical protein
VDGPYIELAKYGPESHSVVAAYYKCTTAGDAVIVHFR